jgi:hypothetical protein
MGCSMYATAQALVRSLDIPTGLGKTAVMAIWLVARAAVEGFPGGSSTSWIAAR